MAKWLVEHGIGEQRALLVENETVLAAKIRWPGELHAGHQAFAKLTSKRGGKRRGIATLDNGVEVLVDHLPAEVTEGATIGIRISRAAISERGRHKLAQARCIVVDNTRVDPEAKVGTSALHDVFTIGDAVRQFPSGLWEDVWSAASSGNVEFPGGEILVSTTPAMTLIDVDGEDDPLTLSLAAIPAIARALHWFEIGGNIGIDFPTIEARADRKKVDAALDEALAEWQHERTAMNGFGFVQAIARLEGPSLLHRFNTSRTAMCARMALRVAERAEGTGPVLELRIHPALNAKMKPEWLEELTRRTGKQVRIETDPGLALEAPQAQILSA